MGGRNFNQTCKDIKLDDRHYVCTIYATCENRRQKMVRAKIKLVLYSITGL